MHSPFVSDACCPPCKATQAGGSGTYTEAEARSSAGTPPAAPLSPFAVGSPRNTATAGQGVTGSGSAPGWGSAAAPRPHRRTGPRDSVDEQEHYKRNGGAARQAVAGTGAAAGLDSCQQPPAVPPGAGCRRPSLGVPPLGAPQPAPLLLRKHLLFADASLEAEYQAEVAERGRGNDRQWVALRALIWGIAAVRLAVSGALPAAALLTLACVLPAVLQLVAIQCWWQAYRRHHVCVSTVTHSLCDAVGFATMAAAAGRLPTGPSLAAAAAAATGAAAAAGAAAAGSSAALKGVLDLPFQGASYMALATLRSSCPFIWRFAANTLFLLAQLCAASALSGQPSTPHHSFGGAGTEPTAAVTGAAAATAAGGSGGGMLPGSQLLTLGLAALAYAVPLYKLYWLEVRQRARFAATKGRKVNTSCLEPWDPLSFIVPALAQAFSLWCHLN